MKNFRVLLFTALLASSLFLIVFESNLASASTPVLETWLASDTAGATATNLDLTKPSGVVTGNLLIIIVGSDDATDTIQFSMADGAWTKDGEAGGGDADAHIGMFWKISTGDETSTQAVTAASADEMYGWYLRLSGAHASTPIHASDYTGNDVPATSFDIAGVTTTVDECRIFYALGFDGADGDPFSISGTGFTETDEHESGTGANDAGGVFGEKDMGATQGATGTATVGTSISDGAASFQFAIAPPTAGPDEEAPVITLPDHTPDNPIETDDVKLDCTITDNVDVTNAYCLTKINTASWNNYSMTEGASDNWYYQSGTYSVGDGVAYYFQARDAANNWVTLDNSGSYYYFNVTDQTSPEITVPDHDPDSPKETDNLQFDCTITDNVDVIYAYAVWRIDLGSWTNSSMTEGASDNWYYQSGTHNIDEDIDYYFQAKDAVYNSFTLDNSGSYYSVTITDQDDPVITSPATDPVTPVKETDDVKIYATITDNDDVVYAFCLIRINAASWNNYSMTEGASDEWYYQSGTYNIGDDVDWYIQAKDNVPNAIVSSTYGFNVTDQTLPVISSPEHSPSTPKETDSVILSATCTDNDDVTNVYVLWQVDGGGFTNSSMSEGGSNVWSFDTGTHAIGELIEYWFKAIDPTGNWKTLDNEGSYYSFYITDQDAPNISNEQHDPSQPEDSDPVQINATVTDNDYVKNASVWWRVNSGSWSEANMSKDVNTYYYTIGSFSSGDYVEYFIEAYDNTGNGVNGTTHDFTVSESDPPSITNVEQLPSSPVTETQTIQINATVTDPNLHDVELYWRINGGSWTNASMSNIEGDIWTKTIGTFNIGDFIEYYIWANDTFNNSNQTSTYNFNVTDQTDPNISGVAHLPDEPNETQTIQINATVTDNGDLWDVELYYRINGGSWTNYTMSNLESDIWSKTIGPFNIGDFIEYYIWANDTYANTQTSSTFDFTVVDSTNPQITNVQQIPSSPITELQTVQINATVTDNGDLWDVELYYRINGGSWTNASMSNIEGDIWSKTIGTFSIGDFIEYYIWANDSYGNTDQSSTYDFDVTDQTDPSISGVAHLPDSPNDTDTIQINATVTDNGNLWDVELYYRINGGSWTNASMSNIEGDIWSKTIGSFSVDDFIEYYIWANDNYANTQTSSTFDFTVIDETNPIISGEAQDPSSPVTELQTVQINATVTDNGYLHDVELYWSVNGGSWINHTMNQDGDVFYYTIGTFNIGDNIEWYIWANDTYGYTAQSSTYDFDVTDQTEPSISGVMHDPSQPEDTDTIQINATVTDNGYLHDVELYWSVNGGSWTNHTMNQDGDVFYYTIGPFNVDDFIEYYIWANDTYGNTQQSSTYDFTIQELYQGPQLNSPNDFSYNESTLGNAITWIAIDSDPYNYSVLRNGVEFTNGTWASGVEIIISVNGLTAGFSGTRVWNITIIVQDLDNNTAFDTVLVTVSKDSGYTIPIPTNTTNPNNPGGSLHLGVKIFLGVIISIMVLGCIFVSLTKEDK